MLEGILPQNIYDAIKSHLDKIDLNEIRLRVNAPVIVSMKNKKYFLGENGFCEKDKAIVCDYSTIQYIVSRLTENSLYSVNDYVKSGYITLPKGVRVGLAGEVVYENGQVRTMKNFQAINIRIPHIVEGCSEGALSYILNGSFLSTLVVAPPGAGKTTFIRDVIWELYKRGYNYNILVADERNEIVGVNGGIAEINLSNYIDVYTNCSKGYAFNNGIRSMRPDIIVCDEIDIDKDLQSIIDATNSGVKILATIHAENIFQLKNKRGFDRILQNCVFDRYIFLSNKFGAGTLMSIYNGNLQCLLAVN